MSTFLIRSSTSQSSSYTIALTRLGESRSRSNPHIKLEAPRIKPATSRLVYIYMLIIIIIIIINEHKNVLCSLEVSEMYEKNLRVSSSVKDKSLPAPTSGIDWATA